VENYEDIYRLCYVRGPEGVIVELASGSADGMSRGQFELTTIPVWIRR
jgi:hypothetical protein